jgi:hypothetical protein
MCKHDAEYFRRRRRAQGIAERDPIAAAKFVQRGCELHERSTTVGSGQRQSSRRGQGRLSATHTAMPRQSARELTDAVPPGPNRARLDLDFRECNAALLHARTR